MTQEIKNTLEALGLTCEFKFIPFSQSRNKAEKYPSLNYSVTCLRNGKAFLTTDYSMGCAHVPGYKQMDKSFDHANMIKAACETGKKAKYFVNTGFIGKGEPILPSIEDVYYSLIINSSVLDYSTFESWASDFGYDPDSRKGEKIYRACLEIALALRSAIGEDGMSQLSEIYQDY